MCMLVVEGPLQIEGSEAKNDSSMCLSSCEGTALGRKLKLPSFDRDAGEAASLPWDLCSEKSEYPDVNPKCLHNLVQMIYFDL